MERSFPREFAANVAPIEQLAARLSDEMQDQLRGDPLSKLIPDVRSISRRIRAIASATAVVSLPLQRRVCTIGKPVGR